MAVRRDLAGGGMRVTVGWSPSQIKGNIRVFCRVRPVNKKELQESPEEAFVVPDDPSRRTIEIKSDGSRVTGQMYEFDRVFGPKSTQEEVFSDVRRVHAGRRWQHLAPSSPADCLPPLLLGGMARHERCPFFS